MATYRYGAYDAAGFITRGEIEAESRADAVSALQKRGLLPFESAEVEAPPTATERIASRARSGRLPLSLYADLTRELSVLLAADLPLDGCLRLLAHQTANRRLKAIAERLLAAVIAGQPLSAALADADPGAPALLVNLVRAGEARGSLAPTLADLAAVFDGQQEIRRKIRSALIYPAVLCVTALSAVVIIVAVLVPALMPIFTETGATPPLILSLAHQFGELVAGQAPLISLSAVLAALAARALLLRPGVRASAGRAALALPVLGPLLRQASTALFARTLGTLLGHGLSLLPALEIAASVVPSAPMRAGILEAAERVKEGRPLTEALTRTARLPEFAIRFIAVGEEASRLDRALLHLADHCDRETQRAIDRAMVLLSPLLTIGIGGVIGTLFVSVVQALLSVNQLALQ